MCCLQTWDFESWIYKESFMDPACRRMMLWKAKLSQCRPRRTMKAMEISFILRITILDLKMSWSWIWTRIHSPCKEARWGWVLWHAHPWPCTGKYGPLCRIAGRKRCQQSLQSMLRRQVNFKINKITRVSTCQKHGKVRAVASVHRQAEKDPAMSLADHKFVCVCSFLPGAASLATCWGDAGQKLGRSGEIYGWKHANGWGPGGEAE